MPGSKPPPARVRATVQYDGAAFHGSQLQLDVRTVQGELEVALSRLLDTPVRVNLAGRTDTGVHATAQEIAFLAPSREPHDLLRGLRALLPPEISASVVRTAPEDFHPRFDAEARRYEYLVACGPGAAHSPFLRNRAWGIAEGVALERLGPLSAALPGERSFGGFAKAGQPERGTRCHVLSAGWMPGPGPYLRFEVVADRFLHHMVRYLVGTMVEIALGRRPEEDLARILAEETPTRPVYPAPPGGLYLTGVRYADGWNAGAGLEWLGGSGVERGPVKGPRGDPGR